MRPEAEYRDCYHCGGTGEDDDNWDGQCIFCDGSGERLVEVDEDEEDE